MDLGSQEKRRKRSWRFPAYRGLECYVQGRNTVRNDMSEWLIREGCPSIAYRVRKEIIQEPISRQEDIHYQNQICSEPKVQKILSWQGSDGYFGERLHTAPSKSRIWTHEGGVRCLLEMGLPKENENVWSALEVMFYPGWGKECENSRAANVFKYEMIRASLLAQAGYEDNRRVGEWVEDALQGFRNLADAKSHTDFVYRSSNQKLIFKEGMYIPVIYHLRLLAFTDFWRTDENKDMVKRAYKKLYEWLPFPPMYYKSKSHPVAPLGNVCWAVNQNFREDIGFFWLQFYELSARMGMLGTESPFRRHFEELKEHVLQQNDRIKQYTRKRKKMYVNWSGYSGMALEGEWELEQQRIRDFIFRILLIDHYGNRF